MLGEIAVARYFLKRKLYCYETSLEITCLKLTNYARLSGRIPYQGHSQSDKPSAIFDHSLVRSMHVLSVLLFLFFLQPEKCKPLRIPRVYISKRKQQSKHSRLQMRLHLFFKFTTNNWLWTRNDNFFLLEVAAIFFSNWIFHHDYEIKKKSVDVKEVFTQFQKNLDYRRSSRISG